MRVLSRFTVLLACLALIALPAVDASAASKGSHAERTFDSASIDKVVVDGSFHKVEVKAGASSQIEVTVDLEFSGSSAKVEALLEDYEPQFKVDGGKLTIKSTREGKSSWNWFGSPKMKGEIKVTMPGDIDLVVDTSSGSVNIEGDFGDAEVVGDTSSGSVSFDGSASEVRGDTSSGAVRVVLDRTAKRVVADTSSGSVYIEGPAESASADTSSGSVQAYGLSGDGNFDTSSGSVKASWNEIPSGASVRADTSSGGVTLTFPQGTELEGVVDTSSGGISSDFPGDYSDKGHHLKLQASGPAVKITVDTSSGGVRLKKD
jgi:hypothetical protein